MIQQYVVYAVLALLLCDWFRRVVKPWFTPKGRSLCREDFLLGGSILLIIMLSGAGVLALVQSIVHR